MLKVHVQHLPLISCSLSLQLVLHEPLADVALGKQLLACASLLNGINKLEPVTANGALGLFT
jgi:hypothetical protein